MWLSRFPCVLMPPMNICLHGPDLGNTSPMHMETFLQLNNADTQVIYCPNTLQLLNNGL